MRNADALNQCNCNSNNNFPSINPTKVLSICIRNNYIVIISMAQMCVSVGLHNTIAVLPCSHAESFHSECSVIGYLCFAYSLGSASSVALFASTEPNNKRYRTQDPSYKIYVNSVQNYYLLTDSVDVFVWSHHVINFRRNGIERAVQIEFRVCV